MDSEPFEVSEARIKHGDSSWEGFCKEPILTLTLKEAIAFRDCPFSNNHATENNYPGFNDVIDKIRNFADEHRNDQ